MNAIAFFHPNMFETRGFVKFHQCDKNSPTRIHIHLENLPNDNKRGIHIHNFGDLSQGCDSACDHYNPFNKKHGNYILHGKNRHVGDMINNIKSKNGIVDIVYEDDLINLFGNSSVVGRMVVVHDGEDDLGVRRNTDKGSATTGNAGTRIACAVIGISKTLHF